MTSSRFAGCPRCQFRQAQKCRRTFRFVQRTGDLPEHASVSAIPSQCARIQKRARGEFIAAALKSPQAGEQIAAVHGGDVARMQRLKRLQVVPIKEMTFETLEPIHGFSVPRLRATRSSIVM